MKRNIPWRVVVSGVVCLGLAWGLRYGVVEGGRLPTDCLGRQDAGCALKDLVVWVFLQQRLGWLALGAGVAGIVLGWRSLAWLGWISGLAGLILYGADFAAPGLLLSLLVLLRRPQQAPHGQQQATGSPGYGLGVGGLHQPAPHPPQEENGCQ